jgi:hypothetical protein
VEVALDLLSERPNGARAQGESAREEIAKARRFARAPRSSPPSSHAPQAAVVFRCGGKVLPSFHPELSLMLRQPRKRCC